MKKIISVYILSFFISSCVQNPTKEAINFLKSEVNPVSVGNIVTESDSPNVFEEFDCPPEGNAKPERVRKLNTFKNRVNFPESGDFNTKITLAEILKSGQDENRWRNSQAARIIGYVYDIKPGGIETTNCKSKDKSYRDTHIELVLNPMSATKKDVMVVEVTPRIRSIMKSRGEDWSTSMLRSKFLGRWVEIEGWMLFDHEHDNMAENTNPGNARNWRGTAWEIHPITSIKITSKPR